MNCEHFRLIFENPKKAGIETFFLKKQKKSEEFKSTHDQNSESDYLGLGTQTVLFRHFQQNKGYNAFKNTKKLKILKTNICVYFYFVQNFTYTSWVIYESI